MSQDQQQNQGQDQGKESDSERQEASDGPLMLRDVAEAIGLVAAPATLLTALGFYFGWKRTQTYAIYFGIDNSMLRFSIQEYLLRSSTSVYTVVLTLVTLGLAVLGAHRLALLGLRTPRGQRAVRWVAVALAALAVLGIMIRLDAPLNHVLEVSAFTQTIAVLTAAPVVIILSAAARWYVRRRSGSFAGLRSLLREAPLRAGIVLVMCVGALLIIDACATVAAPAVRTAPFMTRDTAFCCGTALLIYAGYLWNRSSGRPARVAERTPLWLRTMAVVFVGLLLAVGFFAATDEYAEHVGTREARLTVAGLEERRGVIVYSTKAPEFPSSVRCVPLRDKKTAFRYRCDGLKLLVRTDKGILVLPSTWSRDDGIDDADRVIELTEDQSMRLEFTPGEGDISFIPR